MPFGNTHNNFKLNYSVEEEFPDLSKHNNHMAKILTKELYGKMRDKQTPTGFTLDDVIQTGVDNPGHPFIMTVGCVAGDEESYEVFKDLFDPVISDRHGGYKPTDKHKTDLNFENLKVEELPGATGIILHTDSPASLADSQRRAKAQCYLLKAQISFLSLLELQEETMEHRDALTALICV
ncbi:Creatine kinase M-type [Oryzias melastigma]|uniref:Creatine kinase M-type n=1 Tax=Oryzias melastigma TaxID=30732 RepID=A0A834CME1_ORYME|nr:Creatine kinase M-type [Oryzias melastigma]